MKTFIFLFISLFICSCNEDYVNEPHKVIIIEKDTIVYKDTFELFVYKELVNSQHDSIVTLNNKLDSISSKLFISEYKLNRIKYYNDIAAKGNNIKYLRGWINRVLIK